MLVFLLLACELLINLEENIVYGIFLKILKRQSMLHGCEQPLMRNVDYIGASLIMVYLGQYELIVDID